MTAPKVSIFALALLLPLASPHSGAAQRSDPLATPLPPEVLHLLANEVSGQMAFDNMVKLAGAPWLRSSGELTGETNFYESEEIYRMARSYGIRTVRLDRYPGPGGFEYPLEGELWVNDRSVARIPADPALVASGSRTGEVVGDLIYVPDLTGEGIANLEAAMAVAPERYQGAVALMWSHPRGELYEALDRAGFGAAISFNARERYLDPDQVVYSRGAYAEGENLRLGLTVSWRQWSEMLEDLERGETLTVRARALVEEYPNRFETVYAWIPGTEPELPGVVFTAHLFEGYTKRGANDNMGGPAIQLDILRALDRLIQTGRLPQPRRTIHFIWPNEISGTYEFMRRDPTLAEKLSININMDMVSEGLRRNNSVFTMSETPAHLPSYFDGLAYAVMNYVWRTNDIVYLPDSPRGRPGGQYFPDPMWEKNGSRDAFRFFVHEATGGSDHIVFNNPSVAVPGIEFFSWPDQWYHADKDLPENADPTAMKRVAFIGAATAWVSAHLTDEMVPDLLDAVSDFGYRRVAERGIPRAWEALDNAAADPGTGPESASAQEALSKAWYILAAAVKREMDAVASVHDLHTGSPGASLRVDARVAEWEAYGDALRSALLAAAQARGLTGVGIPSPTPEESLYLEVVPSLAPGIRSVETSLARHEPMQRWTEANPGVLEDLGLTRAQQSQILNFINGKRSLASILYWVRGVTGQDLALEQVTGYLRILEDVGWIVLETRTRQGASP
jgi:aminopeptidase YwaD